MSGLSWSDVSSGLFSARYFDDGFIFDTTAPTLFTDKNKYNYILGYMNSKVFQEFLDLTCQGMHYNNGAVANIPFISNDVHDEINLLVEENINISKNDWDISEVSWEFKGNILVRSNEKLISKAIEGLKTLYENKISLLTNNEERLNKIYSKIYDVELDNFKTSEEEIKIRRLDISLEIKELLSYFIGCLFGRYSLDKEGIVYAGGEFNITEYNKFVPNNNNIIPLLNNESIDFNNDIMSKFEQFLKIVFSEDHISENIDFIADILGKKANETSKNTIRKYFINNFFENHCNNYGNKPIYWLFTSGKNKAFSCLVYQHRIDKNLLSKMRIDYVQPLQNKLEVEQKDLIDILESDATAKDKKDAKNKLKLVEKQIDELKVFHEKLRHMADKQIEIDLDDGVVYNHSLFGDLVAKIK